MRALLCPVLLFLVSFVMIDVFASASNGALQHDIAAIREPALPVRSLRAAKKTGKLSRRDVKGCLRYDHHLHYLDGEYADAR